MKEEENLIEEELDRKKVKEFFKTIKNIEKYLKKIKNILKGGTQHGIFKKN